MRAAAAHIAPVMRQWLTAGRPLVIPERRLVTPLRYNSSMRFAADEARPLLLIEQEPLAPAGHILDWLEVRRIPYESITASAGDAIPNPAAFQRIIALGSERHAYDDHVPWVREEVARLREAVERGVAVLGVCFGGQALARALEADVSRASESEIGWLDVTSARPDVVSAGPWFTWHGDRFAVPDGGTLLAENSHSNQAFSYGPHLGLQFHPEVTPEIIRQWLELAVRQGAISADDAREQLRRVPELYPAARVNAFALFDAWYAGALAPAAPELPHLGH